jgi:hypothetical protein
MDTLDVCQIFVVIVYQERHISSQSIFLNNSRIYDQNNRNRIST